MKNKNKNPPKNEKKLKERERNNLLCMWKLCEYERELEIHSKRIRIRRAKNKGR